MMNAARRAVGILAILSAIAFWIPPLHGADSRPHPRPEWQRDRASLDQRFVCEEFRIFYTLSGKNALPSDAKTAGDEVPDRIRNLALQLLTARQCYVQVLGLRHPFESPRYKGRVKFVDVNVWSLPNSNGMAGDGIVNYHRDNDPPDGFEVVTIDLSNKLSVTNLSPAHELFHLFQNGYSLFKTPWYYEGMPRWSEDLLRGRPGAVGALPACRADRDELYHRSYEASPFWQALARATDSQGKPSYPQEVREVRYHGTDKPIVEDDNFFGAPLLKALLEELDRQDDVASRKAGLNPLDWPEARQRSAENDGFIWSAALAACQRFPCVSPELQRMIAIH